MTAKEEGVLDPLLLFIATLHWRCLDTVVLRGQGLTTPLLFDRRFVDGAATKLS